MIFSRVFTVALMMLCVLHSPCAAQDAELPREGEIRLEGTLSQVQAAQSTLMLLATAFTNSNGKTSRFAAPKLKPIQLSGATTFGVRGASKSTLSLEDLRLNTAAIVLGTDGGAGQPLQARAVLVWDRERNGKYFYSALKAAPPREIIAEPVEIIEPIANEDAPKNQEGNVFPFGDFETVKDGKPQGWSGFAASGAEIGREENGNHFLQLRVGRGLATIQTTIAIEPEWKSLKTSARFRVRDLRAGSLPWQCPRLGVAWLDANQKRLGFAAAPTMNRDTEWVTVSASAPVPVDAKFLQMEASMWGAQGGEAALDDIRVIPNGQPDALPIEAGFAAGTFEKFNANGTPLLWQLLDPARMRIEEENGNHFLRLSSDDAKLSVGINTWLRLDPTWDAIKISLRMRARDLKIGRQAWENARLSLELHNPKASASATGSRRPNCWPTPIGLPKPSRCPSRTAPNF